MTLKYNAVFFAFLIYNICLFGQNDTIEIKKVNIFAQRYFEQEKAGMKTTVIDSLVLKENVNLSLSDVLSQNTPIFVKSMGRGALATASFRGTAPSHTQVSWNGININNPMSGMVDFSLIPVFVIDKMSLSHGTASIADNSGGLGGAVNISSSVDWNKSFEIKYMQSVGSYSTDSEYLTLLVGSENIKSKTRIYRNYSLNNFTFINRSIVNVDTITGELTNPLDTNDNADYLIYGVLQEFFFRPNTKNVFSLKWWGQHADRAIPKATSYEGAGNSNTNNQTDNDNKILLNWKRYGHNNKMSANTCFVTKNILYVLLNNIHGHGTIPAIYSQSKNKSSYNNYSLSYYLPKNFKLKTKLDADFHYVNTSDTVKKTGYIVNRTQLSGLVVLNKSFKERLNLNFMLRQDFVDNKLSPIIPFLGFDFKVLKNNIWVIKGNIGRNYHQPGLNDLYWLPGGNPNLKPEEGYTYELGTNYLTNIKNIKLEAELTAYHSDINNWIIWTPNYKGYWEPTNIKRVLARGVEFNINISGKMNKLMYSLSVSYAYTNSQNLGDKKKWGDESFGKQLVYVPLHSGNSMVYVSYKKFFFTYQHNSYSERFTTSSNNITQRDWLYPYFMNDIALGKDFNIKKILLSVQLKVYNLFNETYHSVLYRPMPKRNYLFIVRIKIPG